MTDLEVLRFMYEHPNRDSGYYINLLEFFIEKYPTPTGGDLRHIKKLCAHLISNEYITVSSEFASQNLDLYVAKRQSYSLAAGTHLSALTRPDDYEILDLSTAEKRRKDALLTGDDGIMALLQIKGRKEYEGLLYNQQLRAVNQSLIDTNTSVTDLNTETKAFYSKQETFFTIQKNYGYWQKVATIIIAAFTAIYTIVTGIGIYTQWQSQQDTVKLMELKRMIYTPTSRDSLSRKSLKEILETP